MQSRVTGKPTVLVVEDDTDDQALILRAMRDLSVPCDVVAVPDGELATDYLFATGRFKDRPEYAQAKVVILDLCLPKVAGLEVLRLIKEDRHLRSIPVVVMTSSERPSDLDRCYELGANSVVRKGHLMEDLKESVALTIAYWTKVNISIL